MALSRFRPRAFALAVLLTTGLAIAAHAENPLIELTIKNHQFEPAELRIPANTKVKLVVKNRDATPEEFESYELKREKIIAGNAEGIVFLGPLPAGTYPFFGDFNQDSAQGRVIVE